MQSFSFAQEGKILSLDHTEKKLPFNLTAKIPVRQPKVALVLSGGGARGLAQIGMMKALEEKNIPINYIVGTSMGSILGGLYSAGYSVDELDSIVKIMPWNDLLSFGGESDRRDLFVDQKITEDKAIFALRLEGLKFLLPTSIKSGQKLSNYLNLLVLNAPIHANNKFDELLYDYKAVCTDLISGNIVVLEKGSLSQAMRASSSFTPVISPVKLDSHLLIDGGLVANVPVQLAKDLGSDFILAFNTTSPLNTEEELTYPWNVADQLVSIPMRQLTEQQLKLADVVVMPELNNKKNNDFTNIDSIIYAGYNATLPYLDEIENKLNEKFNNKFAENVFYIHNPKFETGNSRLQNIFSEFEKEDSVSSEQILLEIYNEFNSGDYDSLYAKIKDQNSIEIFSKLNPEIKKITVKGISVVDTQKVDSILNENLLNKPYNSQRILNSLLEILKMYRAYGYSLADVISNEFDAENNELKLKFADGIINKIIIEGNRKTNKDVIKREFPFNEGDYFIFNKIQRGLANLSSTNLFSDFNLTVNSEENQNVLMLKVLERPSSLLRFGLRIDNENFTQVSVDLRDENIFGTATEFGAIFAGGIRNRAYVLEHKANRIFNTYLTYKLRGFYEFNDVLVFRHDSSEVKDEYLVQNIGEYRQIARGVSIGIGTQVERFGNLILEGKYFLDEVKGKRDFTDSYKENIVSVKLSTTVDSQDKYPFPNKGFLVKASYETAQKIVIGGLSYSKFYFDYKSYFPVGRKHSFSPAFVIGFADRTLPLSQQFSLGGQNSFFGLREHEFRGRQIFTSALQYRYKFPFQLFFDTYFKLRYDLGSIWSSREEIRLKDLRHGIGTSISFDTPLGPADFSVGRSFLLKHSDQEKVIWGPVNLYFTIGYYY